MKDASRVMYVIGKVFNVIEIVCVGLLLIGSIMIVADPARFISTFNEVDPNRTYTLAEISALGITLLVSMIIALAVSIVTLVFANKAIEKLDNGEQKNTLQIVMIVLGVFNSIFYLLGGIFAVVYNGQNNKPAEQN